MSLVTTDEIIEIIRSKLWNRTYLGHRNTNKRSYFDSIAEDIKTKLDELPPYKYELIRQDIFRNPCLIELVVILLRHAKNYRTINSSTNAAVRRKDTAEQIFKVLTKWRPFFQNKMINVTRDLVAILNSTPINLELKSITTTLFKDLYTLYYGNCKLSDPFTTVGVDDEIEQLMPLLPPDTNLGKFIREVPTHTTCMGGVCSFFSGKKSVINRIRGVERPILPETEPLVPETEPLLSASTPPEEAVSRGPPLRDNPYIATDGTIGPFSTYMDNIKYTTKLTKLGVGAFGAVYKFKMPSNFEVSDQEVAVKIIESPSKKIINEAILLHKFSDTGIFPKLYAYGTNKEKQTTYAYIFMEWTEGQTLNNMILTAWPKPTSEKKQELKTKIKAVVRRLHAYGYVHNDLKPENIYIKRNGDILLLDIGSCRQIGTNMADNPASVTDGYYMPHRTNPTYQPELNLYSLDRVNIDIDNFYLSGGKRRSTRRRLRQK